MLAYCSKGFPLHDELKQWSLPGRLTGRVICPSTRVMHCVLVMLNISPSYRWT